MLWGVPGSWLSKADRERLAGRRGEGRLDELDVLGLDGHGGGRAAARRRWTTGPGRRRRIRPARHSTEPPNAPAVPAAVSPMANADSWSTVAMMISVTRLPNSSDGVCPAADVLEVAGRVRLDHLAVLLDRIDEPADEGRDEGDDPGGQQPATEDQPEEQREHPERAEERSPRRAGHVDAGRRPTVDDGGQGRGGVDAQVVVVDAQPLGQPVEERQDEGDDAEDQDQPAEDQTQDEQERADRGEDRGERRAGHVDAGRGPRLDALLAAPGLRGGPDATEHRTAARTRRGPRWRPGSVR